MSESRSEKKYPPNESQKSEKEAETDPVDISALEEMYPLQETNDGTERVFREFSSPEEARFFSKSYRVASKPDSNEFLDKINSLSPSVLEKKSDSAIAREAYITDRYWKGLLLEGSTSSNPVGEDFPLDEECFVLSPNWKPSKQ